jgi:hypothetical protein
MPVNTSFGFRATFAVQSEPMHCPPLAAQMYAIVFGAVQMEPGPAVLREKNLLAGLLQSKILQVIRRWTKAPFRSTQSLKEVVRRSVFLDDHNNMLEGGPPEMCAYPTVETSAMRRVLPAKFIFHLSVVFSLPVIVLASSPFQACQPSVSI